MHCRQQALLLARIGGIVVVGRFDIHLQESVKLDYLAGSREVLRAVAYVDIHIGALHQRISHLRRDCALPDEGIELLLLHTARHIVHGDICRTDSLMRLLRTLRAGVVFAYFQIFFTNVLLNLLADSGNGKARQIERVGTHIGNKSRLI